MINKNFPNYTKEKTWKVVETPDRGPNRHERRKAIALARLWPHKLKLQKHWDSVWKARQERDAKNKPK